MLTYLWPALAGILSAAAWTVWTASVASGNAIAVAGSELALLVICRMSWRWYKDEREAEWWVFAVSSAVASGVVVWWMN